MKHLGQRYVQFINRTYQRTGALWDGRFKSCLTQEERYVLACYRHIELIQFGPAWRTTLVAICGPEGCNGTGNPNA
jgi:hypothetical protein